MRLLIVEDYKKINDLLALFARQDQHLVTQAQTAEKALETLQEQQFDAIILDLMLPEMQGETLIKKIRSFSDVYILVISAKVEVEGRIDVISLGADDYMTKPFSVEEVMAKLKNIEKRISIKQPTAYTYNHNDLSIYPLKREVRVNNHLITLTEYEFDILWHLAKNAQRVYSREEIIEKCFTDSEAYDRVIDVFIKNIRKKIDSNRLEGSYIKTHYGVGYQFVGEKDV